MILFVIHILGEFSAVETSSSSSLPPPQLEA